MGSPKLLLPWPRLLSPAANTSGDLESSDLANNTTEFTLIDHVLQAWTSSRIDEVVVVVRADDALLVQACRRWNVSVVQPSVDPRDMKESIQHGLRFLQKRGPSAFNHFMVAPADLPTISSQIIDRLIETDANESEIVVPVFGTKAAHPVRLPWHLSEEIFQLGENEGLDRVVAQQPQLLVEFASEELVDDVDTPSEYHAALQMALKKASNRSESC